MCDKCRVEGELRGQNMSVTQCLRCHVFDCSEQSMVLDKEEY